MRPWSIKITRLPTLRAKPISWVTQHIVMPSLASFTMTSNTSPTISGSSAEVGSSNSIRIGSILKARAIATRCCWPPESWPGNLSFCAMSPTRSRYLRPWVLASSLDRPKTFTWARVRFSVTLKWGNSSKFWNTIPTRARNLGRFVLGSCKLMPSTVISPFWNGSRALIVLIKVDLPDPEGPQITTTSPLLIEVVQSVKTWKEPYHLETFWSSIMMVYVVYSDKKNN